MPQINEEYLQLDRSPAALRRFGWTVGGVLVSLGGLLVWRERVAGWPMIGLGGLLLLGALAAPNTLRVFHRVWMMLALLMGWIMTNVILTVVFFLVVTPIRLLQRALGKRTLDLEFKTGAKSYWEDRATPQPTRDDYEKQF